jgi:hypothetical protein
MYRSLALLRNAREKRAGKPGQATA